MKIIMLAGNDISTNFIYNGLYEKWNIEKVLLTNSPSRKKIIKRRIKNLGYINVLNQLLFVTIIVKILKVLSKTKYEVRRDELKLNSNAIPMENTNNVGLVNSKKTINIIKELNPDIVIVNGTSIISTEVLNCSKAIFINTHVGITPEYRGVHGGYWSLRNNDESNFGVTVHIVDKGIDTGSIIYQETTKVNRDDNFITYPLLQYALAIPLLKKALDDLRLKKIATYKKSNSISKLYYHPTFSRYMSGLLFKGVK